MRQYKLEELVVAYRKVKADMYHDKNNISLIKIADFEKRLLKNLNEILTNLNSNNISYFERSDFVGGINVSLKSISFESDFNKGVIFSNEFDNNKIHVVDKLDFRFVGDLSIAFQVLGSLWIDKIGIHLEQKLSKNSYGCRLDKEESNMSNIGYNNLNSHYRPYFIDYKAWQEDSLQSISKSLKEGKRVAVLSTDIKGFYHSINPSFILDYFRINGEQLTEYSSLNTIFCAALLQWSNINISQVRTLHFHILSI
jgi:hypothetical protein